MKKHFAILKNKIAASGSCFFDSIFPKRCVSCGRQGTWLCQPCSESLFFRSNQDCLVCGRPNQDGSTCSGCESEAHTRRVLCAFTYHQDVVVRLVKLFKYDFVRTADEPLCALLLDFVRSMELHDDLLVMPVPLHIKRLRWRGYNQSAVLAKAVAESLGYEYEDAILAKHRPTKPQAKMDTAARCSNVDGCFSTDSNDGIAGKRILLVDDVITTGATIEACAAVLKQAGAKSVDALALIRG